MLIRCGGLPGQAHGLTCRTSLEEVIAMQSTAMFLAALVILPAIGLLAWVWFAMRQAEEDLQAFSGVSGMRFDR
jgi:NADH:ubiquinone oxidoreductase subunit D